MWLTLSKHLLILITKSVAYEVPIIDSRMVLYMAAWSCVMWSPLGQ